MTWQGALMTAAIALATAIAGGWFNKPKTRGQGKEAEGAGNKSDAEARAIVDDSVWRRANEAIAAAESAKKVCEDSKREMRREFAAFIDFMDDMVELMPAASRSPARERIRTARDAL